MGYNQFFVCYYSNSPIIYGAIFGSLDTILYFNSVTPKKSEPYLNGVNVVYFKKVQ